MLMSIASRYVRDHSERPLVLNQSFVRIVRGLEQYEHGRNFNAWAYRVAVNTNLDYLRKKSRTKEDAYEDDLLAFQLNGQGIVDYNQADEKYDAEDLLEMIEGLPPKTAQVFNLFAIDGYSHEEIAKELGMSTGTSKWHVSSAREKLRALLLNQAATNSKHNYESR
jgi:RNA polymerase sigma-70 factor (ECF subfamily)